MGPTLSHSWVKLLQTVLIIFRVLFNVKQKCWKLGGWGHGLCSQHSDRQPDRARYCSGVKKATTKAKQMPRDPTSACDRRVAFLLCWRLRKTANGIDSVLRAYQIRQTGHRFAGCCYGQSCRRSPRRSRQNLLRPCCCGARRDLAFGRGQLPALELRDAAWTSAEPQHSWIQMDIFDPPYWEWIWTPAGSRVRGGSRRFLPAGKT